MARKFLGRSTYGDERRQTKDFSVCEWGVAYRRSRRPADPGSAGFAVATKPSGGRNHLPRQGAFDRVVRYPEIEGDRVRELDGKFCGCADRSGLSTISSEN